MDWNRIDAASVLRLRLERGLKHRQLAHECELDLTYVGGIERGRRNPSVKVIGRFTSALGVHHQVLFETSETVDLTK